ncbi:protein Shroom1 [Latimeria chalumnae]|uniref:protein Shroom1 n=1 Tax=Latimeria chalumnae TaxID=7897 RepID=UPI0003C120E8
MNSIDQLPNIHRKGDSAYSSFSGSSSVPEYPSPLSCNENSCLSSKQFQYIDSEYVKAIYNPMDTNHDVRDIDGGKTTEVSTWGFESQRDPPAPPARIDSFIAIKNFDNVKGNRNSENQFEQVVFKKLQTICVNEAHCGIHPELNWSQKVSPDYHHTSVPKKNNLICKDKDDVLGHDTEQKTFQNTMIRLPPSFTLQEHLQENLDTHVYDPETQKHGYGQKLAHSGKSTGQPIPHSCDITKINPNTTISTKQNKEQCFFVTGLNGQPRGVRETNLSAHHTHQTRGAMKGHLDMHEDISQESAALKSMNGSHTNENIYSRQSSLEKKNFQHDWKLCNLSPQVPIKNEGNSCLVSNHKESKGGSGFSQDQRSKNYKLPASQSLNFFETEYIEHGEFGFRSRQCHSNSNQIFYCGPTQNLQTVSGPSVRGHEQQADKTASVSTTQQSDIPSKFKRQTIINTSNKKISKETTPLLYQLAGEKCSSIGRMFSNPDQAKQPQESIHSTTVPQKSNHCSVAECKEVPIQLLKSKSYNRLVGVDADNQNYDEALGSSGSSVDETFKKDYRERIKDAQCKVLRETSFKRKDLQMSLPFRFKKTSCERPSILHLRSSSLSNTIEGIKPDFTDVSSEMISNHEEAKKSQVIRKGGKKRLTAEQKKRCYSEPEKLNQVGSSCGQPKTAPVWKKDQSGFTSLDGNSGDSLVATRKEAFAKGGRAHSATSFSKTELKQIQYNALMEYIERKISQRSTFSQQMQSQKSTQRPSTPGRLPDWNSNQSRKIGNPKSENISRPLSAGQVLESSFDSYISRACLGSKPHSSNSVVEVMDSESLDFVRIPARNTDKSASAESLLDPLDPVALNGHTRSKSTPFTVQVFSKYTSFTEAPFPVQNRDADPYSSQQQNSESKITREATKSILPEGQKCYVARERGKSMEELGTAKLARPSVLSKSIDQLHPIKNLETGIPSSFQSGKHELPAESQSKLNSNEFTSQKVSIHSQEWVKASHEEINGLKQKESQMKPTSIPPFERHPNLIKPNNMSLSTESLSLKPLSSQSVLLSSVSKPQTAPHSLSSVSFQDNGSGGCDGGDDDDDDDVFSQDMPTKVETNSLITLHAHVGHHITCEPDSPKGEASSSEDSLLTQSLVGDKKNKMALCNSLNVAAEAQPSLKEGNKDNMKYPWDSRSSLLIQSEVGTAASDLNAFPFETSNRASDEKFLTNKEERTQLAPESITLIQEPTTLFSPTKDSEFVQGQDEVKHEQPTEKKSTDKTQDNVSMMSVTLTSKAQLKSEDQKYEDLAKENLSKYQSLADILAPCFNRKTAVDLMEGLFPVDTLELENQYMVKQRTSKGNEQGTKTTNMTSVSLGVHSMESPTSAFSKNEEGPAGNDSKYSSEILLSINQIHETTEVGSEDQNDITAKKKELIVKIQCKAQDLQKDKEVLQKELKSYNMLGEALESLVKEVCKPNEYERYMMFIGDLEKVVNLLLCLSSRLARVENALCKVNESTDAEEKKSLNERHNLLTRQREDAKDLKENLERRERVVSDILCKYWNDKQLQDYKHFVKMKASLLIKQKDLEEKIKCCEEWLESIQNCILS